MGAGRGQVVQPLAPVVERQTTQPRMHMQLPTLLKAGLLRGRSPILGSLLELASELVEGLRQPVSGEATVPPSPHPALPL